VIQELIQENTKKYAIVSATIAPTVLMMRT